MTIHSCSSGPAPSARRSARDLHGEVGLLDDGAGPGRLHQRVLAHDAALGIGKRRQQRRPAAPERNSPAVARELHLLAIEDERTKGRDGSNHPLTLSSLADPRRGWHFSRMHARTRSQFKPIFAKTGTRRQVGLSALLASIAICQQPATAPLAFGVRSWVKSRNRSSLVSAGVAIRRPSLARPNPTDSRAMPIRRLQRTWSTASPPARWSSGRRASSRNWSRTRSTPARARIEIVTAGGGVGADPGQRRRRRHRPRRPRARGRAPLHLEARRRPRRHPLARLPRRGAGGDRRGGAAVARLAAGAAATALGDRASRAAGSAPVEPAALSAGTRVEVRDLFFATPARLKFLKSERAEAAAITDVVKRLAMAHPEVRFTLVGQRPHRARPIRRSTGDGRAARPASRAGDRRAISATTRSRSRRCAKASRLAGFAGLPTFSRANGLAPVPLRQRPAGARQAAPRRAPRRLCRPAEARPPPGGGAVHRRSIRARSTSTSIRPRPRSASAIPAWSAA